MERHFPLSQMQWTPPSYWLQITQQCTVSWYTEHHWFFEYWPTSGYSCQGLRQDLCNHVRKYWTWLHYQRWSRQPWCCRVQPMSDTNSPGCFLPAVASTSVFAFQSATAGTEWSHLIWEQEARACLQQDLQKLLQQMELLTHILQFTQFCGKWQVRHLLFSEIPTQNKSLLCSSPIMINSGKYTTLKTGRALNLERSGGASSDRWSRR